MNVAVNLAGILLQKRHNEWTHHLAHLVENLLSTWAGFADGEVLLKNDLCVYVQDSRYCDGLARLDASVNPGGDTVGWKVLPAGGVHIPHVHPHVIPGAGLRYFLKAACEQERRR